MESSRLKKILYFFEPLARNPEKWLQFKEYLISPLHANSPKAGEILDCMGQILRKIPANPEAALAELVFPGKSYADPATRSHLRRRLSPILEHYFEFEAFLSYRQNEALVWRLALHQANELKWDPYFPWLYQKKGLKSLENLPRTENWYLYKMDLSEQWDIFSSRQEKNYAHSPDRYQGEWQALDAFHTLSLLKLACNMYIHAQEANIPFQPPPLLRPLLKFIRKNPDQTEPLIRIYSLIFKCLKNASSTRPYLKLEELILAQATHFGKNEALNLCSHATNLCTIRYNLHRAANHAEESDLFGNKLMRLLEFQLDNRILLEVSDGVEYLDHRQFKNIVDMFSRLGDFGRAGKFVEKYSALLLKEMREIARDFALGILKFRQTDFAAAEDYFFRALQPLKDSHDPNFALSVKGYYVRALFERQKWEDCEREAYNFGRSARKNQTLPAQTRQKFVRFTLFSQELCRIEAGPPALRPAALADLKSRIETGPPVISRDWLLHKASP
ncbi:MAG: hypothetical protein H6581_24175 [Bacteroidia bacterium]|nr:hypothetical protein [Bacteroidia bacterium]